MSTLLQRRNVAAAEMAKDGARHVQDRRRRDAAARAGRSPRTRTRSARRSRRRARRPRAARGSRRRRAAGRPRWSRRPAARRNGGERSGCRASLLDPEQLRRERRDRRERARAVGVLRAQRVGVDEPAAREDRARAVGERVREAGDRAGRREDVGVEEQHELGRCRAPRRGCRRGRTRRPRSSATTSTAGCESASACAVPSHEPLSTTMTLLASGSSARLATQPSVISRVSAVTITTSITPACPASG